MRFLTKAPDGGENSGVTGYYFCEIKSLFSIILLNFNKGTRDAYHSHAFNAVTLWLKGKVIEHNVDETIKEYKTGQFKYTSRDNFHKVEALENTWALSIRGPWVDKWQEKHGDKIINLTHGRQEI